MYVLYEDKTTAEENWEISPGKPASEHTPCLFMGSKANILGRASVDCHGALPRCGQYPDNARLLVSSQWSLCVQGCINSKATLKYQSKTEFLTRQSLIFYKNNGQRFRVEVLAVTESPGLTANNYVGHTAETERRCIQQ